MTMTPPDSGQDVDLSDLPEDLDPELVAEISAARLKRLEAEHRKLNAEAEFRHQKSLGQRYREWALDDSIGKELELAFTPRGRTA